MNTAKPSIRMLKIAPSYWKNESRDMRELNVVKELGVDVMVLAKGDRSRFFEYIDEIKICRMSTRPLGQFIPIKLNRLVSIFTWAYEVRQIAPHIISGHDIIALLIGYLSALFSSSSYNPKLIYDSHEFELGRNAKRGRIKKWLIHRLEGFLIKRCAFSIMVNESIANEVQKIYKLPESPLVVRNIPDYWKLDSKKIMETRRNLCKKLGAEENAFFLMYHGMVAPNRGIENMLIAVARLPEVSVVVIGDASKEYLVKLRQLAVHLNILNRVLFISAMPLEQLNSFVASADVGMITIPATCKSYYFGLPNKLFENIQALTPVIVSNYPEMIKIVKKFEIGCWVNPLKVDEIVKAVKKMKEDVDFYKKCKENLKPAKERLCWNNEKKVLKEAYRKVIEEIEGEKTCCI